MSRRSLRDNRRHDGPILSTPNCEPILKWMSCSSVLQEDAVFIEETTGGKTNSKIYVSRPTYKNSPQGCYIKPFKVDNVGSCIETSNCEILTDPAKKTVWKRITEKFNPKAYGALPANVEWKNEPNKYIGRVSWEGGAVTVGTILFEQSVWKVRYGIPQNFHEEDVVELNNTLYVSLSCEVLCLK